MACKCNEIKKCKNDMDNVQEIRAILLNLVRSNSELSGVYTDLSSKTNETFTTVNMDSLMTEEKKLNYDISPNIDKMLMMCNGKTLKLEAEHALLVAEDKAFHGLEELKNFVTGGTESE